MLYTSTEPSLPHPNPPVSSPLPPKFTISFCYQHYMHIQCMYMHICIYNLLNPFGLVCMCMCPGYTSWHWKIYVGVPSWRKVVLPLSEEVTDHLGVRRCGICPVLIQLVLSLCWSRSDSRIVEMAAFPLPYLGSAI